MTELQKHLRKLGACNEAREWADDRTAQQAWDESPRADWLLWWAAKCDVDRKLLVLAACKCARRALRFVPDGELRPLRAIEAAEAWIENPSAAWAAAEEAAWASAAWASAAWAAAEEAAEASAAWAAWASAWAASSEASAAAAAWAAEASAAAAWAEHIELCKIVREIIPFELIEKNIEKNGAQVA